MTGRHLRYQPWRVLSGLQPPEFGLQPQLCLFQIKYWLTGPEPDVRAAFSRAAAMFTLYHLQDGLQRFANASPSWKMGELLKNPTYASLFDESFARGTAMDLLGLWSLEEEVEWRQEHQQFVKYDTRFALCRLGFIVEKGDSRKQSAEIYIEKDKSIKTIGLSWSDRYKEFRERAAFLVAAHWNLPSLLEFGEDVFLRLDQELPESETFQRLCGQVRTVSRLLGCSGDKEIERWTGIPPVEHPDLDPIPTSVINAWSSKNDRPADETSVGKRGRQKPVTERP